MNRAAILPQAEPRDESTPPKMPEIVTASSYQNAELIQKIKGVSEDKIGVFDLAQQIESRARVVADGDLCHVEMSLISQAASLEALYSNLIDRALRSKEMTHIEVFFRLGLRAQNQCRATLETLATIKNPPVIFAKQANFAAGHQQVNNGNAPAPAHGKIETVPNELMTETRRTEAIGEVKHERLDTRTPGAASGANPAMATVGAQHRSTNTRRQGKIKPERTQADDTKQTVETSTHRP